MMNSTQPNPIDAVLVALNVDSEGDYVLTEEAAQGLSKTWESLIAEGDALDVFAEVLRCCLLLQNKGASGAAAAVKATLGPWLHLAVDAGMRKEAFVDAQQTRAKNLLGGPVKPVGHTEPLPVDDKLKLEFESMRKQQDFSVDRRRAGAKRPSKSRLR